MYYDEEGNFFVTDRIQEMICYKGHHVSPAMIEQVLGSHPGVSEVAVVPKFHTDDDEHPVAFVVKTLDYPVCIQIININWIKFKIIML